MKNQICAVKKLILSKSKRGFQLQMQQWAFGWSEREAGYRGGYRGRQGWLVTLFPKEKNYIAKNITSRLRS